jgi:hypothetical protein
MPVDLTGVWSCDDGGIYYIRQLGDTVVWAGLHDSGFHKGIEFANVFRGTFSTDGQSVSGKWVDVPRGGTESSGNLRFTIQNANVDVLGIDFDVRELVQDPNQTTGGFGGKLWVKDGAMLVPQDIVQTANQVQRYDKLVGENNPPCRDFTVMWGYTSELGCSKELYDLHKDRISTGFRGPDLPPDDSYCSFVQSGRGWWSGWLGQGWGGDGDFTFNLVPDWNLTDPAGQFWATGWVQTPIEVVTGWYWDGPIFGPMAPSQYIHMLFDEWQFFHCENMMYGRTNSDDDDECNAPANILLPGWNEASGNSVLVNGRPIEGRVGPPNQTGEHSRFTFFELDPNGPTEYLLFDQQVRVTGVVADDAGHKTTFEDGGFVYQPPEIHPVYQIDIITDAFKKASSQTLSGAWHGTPDNGTYYIRQLGDDIWWLGLSRDQGRTFANVFRGTYNDNAGLIEGEWVDVPMGVGGMLGGGTLRLACQEYRHDILKVSDPAVFGASSWTKLYDTPGVPAPEPGETHASLGATWSPS